MADPVFLLDSNICIYLLEGLSEAARDRIQLYQPGEVTTSAVAYAEVIRGLPSDDRRAARKVAAFFAQVQILPFDEAAARAYTLVPFRRAQFDRLIVAHALSRDLVMVTNNERDFADVPGLRVENWLSPP